MRHNSHRAPQRRYRSGDKTLAILRIRPDGGFASPEVLDFLDTAADAYVVAMASNVRLVKRSRRLMGRARMLSKASGETISLTPSRPSGQSHTWC